MSSNREQGGIVFKKTNAAQNIAVMSYREDDAISIPCTRLTDEDYARGLQRFVPVCADVVPINAERKIIYLAKRKIKPAIGLWWIGGSIQANQTPLEGAVSNFKRETGLVLEPSRLCLQAVMDYMFKDRQQQPQNIGCHTLALVFSVDLTDEEVAQVQLHPDEYEGRLIPFKSQQELQEAQAPLSARDLYSLMF